MVFNYHLLSLQFTSLLLAFGLSLNLNAKEIPTQVKEFEEDTSTSKRPRMHYGYLDSGWVELVDLDTKDSTAAEISLTVKGIEVGTVTDSSIFIYVALKKPHWIILERGTQYLWLPLKCVAFEDSSVVEFSPFAKLAPVNLGGGRNKSIAQRKEVPSFAPTKIRISKRKYKRRIRY
ncbi:MAG: hypothetical protein HWD92_02845 [Flavobacteriia bacterium]|nr:hypothetical protein [Flavobacteriia bacterium]